MSFSLNMNVPRNLGKRLAEHEANPVRGTASNHDCIQNERRR